MTHGPECHTVIPMAKTRSIEQIGLILTAGSTNEIAGFATREC